MKDRLGLSIFTFAAVVSALAALEQPIVLAWLAALHNAILAALYARRKPASSYDQRGNPPGYLYDVWRWQIAEQILKLQDAMKVKGVGK